ncbi:MAG: hypothetical protein WC127_07900 [Acidaminococcaceae bacterium]
MTRRNGFLLLEILLATMFICVLFATFYQLFLQKIGSLGRIYADIELHRAARVIISSVESELVYSTREIVLEENKYGSMIICQNIGLRRSVVFYCRNMPNERNKTAIYKSTKIEDRTAGINPLSSPEVSIEQWQCEKINAHTLRLKMQIKITTLGRCKTFVEVIRLCNGCVI